MVVSITRCATHSRRSATIDRMGTANGSGLSAELYHGRGLDAALFFFLLDGR